MCRFAFVKLTMLLLNLLISAAGLMMLIAGIWGVADGGYFHRMLAPFSWRAVNVSILCATLGAGLLTLGMLGCGGVIRESKCLLLAFFSLLLAIFIANVASGVVALAYSSLAERIVGEIASTMLREDYGGEPLATKIWNATMRELACCGYSSYVDFKGSTFAKLNAGMFPPTCCRGPALCALADAVRSNVQGCSQAILTMLTEHANVIGAVAVGVGTLETAAMTVSMCLYRHLHQQAN